MHQAVEEIIDRLIGAVKSDKPYYTLKDCLSAGFPTFIVERIRIEINEKLKKEFVLEDTEWANTDQQLVKDAWKEFQQALFANSRIPKDKFYVVTSRVMTEIVKVYLEPRHHMADYIYKGEEELDYEELVRRTDKLTIYKHFGKAIPLYMKKRKLKTLEKKRCKLLIHNLDANLVASYTAKEWAQVLELLFTLFGGEVDAKLIQLFFEDKGLYLTAKAFNELDEQITKERFIEILSYPDLLDVKLQEKFRDQFREELIAQKNRFDHPDEEEMEEIDEKEQRLLDSFFGDYSEEGPQMTDEESFNALFKTEQKDKSIFEEFEEVPDAEKISESLKTGDQTDEIKKFRENLVTVLDQAAHSFKNLTEEEEEEEKKKSKKKKKKSSKKGEKPAEPAPEKEEEDVLDELAAEDDTDESVIEEEAEDNEEQPMWQQFIRPDQMDMLMSSKGSDSDDMLIDEETLVDELVDEEDEDDQTMPTLKDFMINNEGFFVEEIFKGSDKKYEKALSKIQELDNWDEATEFIEKKVFSTNKVDMTSEVAIDFTDRLQAYFDEYKS
ncbi:MAG: hypothetical protein JJ953_06605 [Gracilimonas sp.]|uniref:hypothetical protein n=1 Tax=Gracilimonas TaxID=649462 RepID=UPI001B0F8D68|nr:hypothetical protein [Gracilimonas sp.]MBO6585758.1 hypothetical protein [Gracilimonas sp.]MBO6616755.1 hypothetical protein [Gracilimonas sp.]